MDMNTCSLMKGIMNQFCKYIIVLHYFHGPNVNTGKWKWKMWHKEGFIILVDNGDGSCVADFVKG